MTRQSKLTRFSSDDFHRQIFGQRLRDLMDEYQISQADLAASTGITQSKISRYMRGKNEPKLADLAAICVYLNVSTEVFLDSSIPVKPLTSAAQTVDNSALFGLVEHRLFRNLFQMLQSKLVTIKPGDRQKYLQDWLRFAEIATNLSSGQKVSAGITKAFTASTSQLDLTDAASAVRSVDVKAQMPSLLERLNRATKETGKMSALADFLNAPLASVSRWLSGKREPGGEVALKMLHWVEQQERQPK